jgi:ELP3 family radical SAM enzyme/protein acetyltransferase
MGDIEDFFTDLRTMELAKCRIKHKLHTNKRSLIKIAAEKGYDDIIPFLRHKSIRSDSGVVVITVVMRPDKFSCPNDCHYCPNEPGQPRSYLSNEPAVARANESQFDCVSQVHSRINTLRRNGHPIDKLEIIVLGGTFSSYPRDYQYEFMRDLYYAANIIKNDSVHHRMSLEIEQSMNEVADVKIIGISLETRPDHITKGEIRRFRTYGCTRVQLGVQHTDNAILDGVNRGHTVESSIKAIRLLRDNGFKVDLHIMPDLPGSTPEKDKVMITTILESPDFIPDYLKIYPCLDVDFTEIRKWKLDGRWKPYADSDDGTLITEVVLHAKKLSKEYIRYNRIQRDFCEEAPGILGYESKNIRSNFRQLLELEMKKRGMSCRCIRCREIRNAKFLVSDIYYKYETYNTNGGLEYFVSATVNDNLIGFIRVRIPNENSQMAFQSLHNCALVRELHVYGMMTPVSKNKTHAQHFGVGTQLLKYADTIAIMHTKTSLAVISGVGVRNYYRKFNYVLDSDGNYLIKSLNVFNVFIAVLTLIHFIFHQLRFCNVLL